MTIVRSEVVPVSLYGVAESACVPTYAHPGDAGADLIASSDALIEAGKWALVNTNISLALPDGTVGMVCPRSGLAAKFAVTVLNAPGIVDSGYRGEVKVALINLGTEAYQVRAGDRIAQLVIVPFLHGDFISTGKLPQTNRGSGGFGSSGI